MSFAGSWPILPRPRPRRPTSPCFAGSTCDHGLETHIDKALAELESLSDRELEATAEKLSRRRDGLRPFGFVFSGALGERKGQSWKSSRADLETAIARADDRLLEQIEDAEAPFWRHVRDALAERQP